MPNITFLLKSTDFESTKQIEEIEFSTEVIEYDTSPLLLSRLADSSFLIQWIIDKIIWWTNTKLIWENKNIETLEKIKNTLIKYWTKNLFINWNTWFEVIKNNKWEVVKLIPIITDTIRLLPWWEWAVQKIWTSEVYFNIFEPDIEIRKRKEQDFKLTKSKKDKLTPSLINGKYITWYNPNLNDVILVKDINIDSKYYWKAKIKSIVDQVLLLNYIDDFFVKFFERWTMKSIVFCDKTWKLTTTDKKLLKTEFETKAKWIKKAFNAMIISWDIDHIILDSDVDPVKFNWMRQELRKDIIARLNIPYDIIYTDNSNKASIQTSKELFYSYTIKPLQEIFIEVLNDIEIYNNWNSNSSSNTTPDIKFEVIDTKDTLEESKTLTALKTAWIITANEARTLSNYELEEILWGEDLETTNNQATDLSKEEKEELIKKLSNV